MKEEIPPQSMTLREFQFWLEGLLSGNDNPKDLPKREQWQQIITRLAWIADPQNAHTSHFVTRGIGGGGGGATSSFSQSLGNYTHTNTGGINGSSS